MQTLLDIDYHDECLFGNGDLDSITRLFENARNSGFDSMLWAPMVCGRALFPSKIATPIRKNRQHPGSHYLDELLGKFDPLEEAVRLAREFGLELLFYFRLFDDFHPGLEEGFLSTRPDLWWQSRCGDFAFKGWPSYHQPEVREYKMRLFQELLAYNPDGFMVEVSRSHSWYTNPQRSANFFGYEAPVAEEYERRYGVDIRAFDYVNFLENREGIYSGIPYTYSVDYVNAREFDLDAWHWLKGEAVDSFLRELRAVAPDKRLLMQGGLCPPHPGARDERAIAKFYIDANALAAGGIIDGYSYSQNFRSFESAADIDSFFFPYFDGVRQAGKPVGAWLNDILTSDGGHGVMVGLQEVQDYVDRIQDTTLDYVVIHEADFINRHPQNTQVWQTLKELSVMPVMNNMANP